jgi:hypothetical protein
MMPTSRLSVTLPESEINFLKQYAKKEKTTISRLIDRWIKSLKTKTDIHPDIKKFTGIIPADVDVDKAITDYVMEKHK